MDIHRERRRRQSFVPVSEIASLPEPEGAESLESSLLDSELGSFIRACIEDLSPRLRSVAEPYLLRDLRYSEIALQLEITEVSVRKRMQEARSLLRERIEDYREGRARRPTSRERRPPPRNRPAPSLAALREYVRRHPRGWKKRLELALRLREEGSPEEAVEHLRLALERQPGWGILWRELGRTLDALGRVGEAVAAFDEALRRLRDPEALETVRRERESAAARQATNSRFRSMRRF
jgi:tetratricopeptide (TPR) repeat protein